MLRSLSTSNMMLRSLPVSVVMSRHAMTIVLDEATRVRRFFRELIFSVRSYAFRVTRERASFQSIVSTAKKAKLMVLEEFREPKRTRSSG
ncbi:hypothetical protein H5410_004607 [Solanum commersonii]|uniref:Uncharacterized protein n=1 Tax=Solanum commersonii TaxID=4109 RepID=A0A9J6B8H7_SOLCO|nr:hypothetical protein H5410_004607 [Solanum commersonii]